LGTLEVRLGEVKLSEAKKPAYFGSKLTYLTDELDMMQTRFMNGFIQLLLPNALMFELSCQFRKRMERMLGL